MDPLLPILLLMVSFVLVMLGAIEAWAVLRGMGLLLLAVLAAWAAYQAAPIVDQGSGDSITGTLLASDAGKILTAFAAACALFGAWQLLTGIWRLIRRGVAFSHDPADGGWRTTWPRILGWTLLTAAAIGVVVPLFLTTTAIANIDQRDWYGLMTVYVLVGATLLARDTLGRPRAFWRGLLLLLTGFLCATLGGTPTTSEADEMTAIGVRVIAILFAMIGAYQLVLGMMAARHEQ